MRPRGVVEEIRGELIAAVGSEIKQINLIGCSD